jgi:hypothetical protein
VKYEVSCIMHFDNQADRDEVLSYLQAKKAVAHTSLPGHIESHLCGHDEGLSCENIVSDLWGELNE